MTPRMILAAGVAALALTAPAASEPGKGGGKGKGGAEQQQQAQPQQQARAERPQRAERQQMPRVERQEMRRAERQEARRFERPMRSERQEFRRVERQEARRAERQEVRRAERQEIRRAERQDVRRADRQDVRRAERQEVRRAERQEVRRTERQLARRNDQAEAPRIERIARRADRIERRAERAERNIEKAFTPQGLPHILGRHDMRPMAPSRVAQRVRIGERIAAASLAPVPALYAMRYADTDDYYYRYDDDLGYVYRLDRDDGIVRAMIPLFGGYTVGSPWPVTYRSSYVPFAYRDLYYDTNDYYYRYDGTGIYRIDAGTQLITALVALLTGQGLGVGQLLPASYGVYNVPLAYRSTYYDRDDAWYRYGDGFIYEVDPYSRRIEQRYPLYAGYDDYLIGQPWPVAYPDYNVPYAYRDMYYDTPQYQYRYANGGIYRVDPTTQLITALVALVTGQQFQVGQPMPAGYSAYNVPFALRDEYYDRGDDWYRYADGYVYRVDADSGLIEEAIPVYA